MGIVKFIELGVWPIKLCLYCFNTSGSPHLNLPRVMSEMNSPTSSKIPSTNPWICTASRSFPVLSAGTTGMCRAEGMHRDVPLLRLELLVFLLAQKCKLCQPYTSRNVPGDKIQLFAEAIPPIWTFWKHLQACSYRWRRGFESVFSWNRFADSISICSAAALAALPLQVPRKPETALLPVRTGMFI